MYIIVNNKKIKHRSFTADHESYQAAAYKQSAIMLKNAEDNDNIWATGIITYHKNLIKDPYWDEELEETQGMSWDQSAITNFKTFWKRFGRNMRRKSLSIAWSREICSQIVGDADITKLHTHFVLKKPAIYPGHNLICNFRTQHCLSSLELETFQMARNLIKEAIPPEYSDIKLSYFHPVINNIGISNYIYKSGEKNRRKQRLWPYKIGLNKVGQCNKYFPDGKKVLWEQICEDIKQMKEKKDV